MYFRLLWLNFELDHWSNCLVIKLKVGVPHFEIEIEMKPPVPGATTQSITLVQIYIYIYIAGHINLKNMWETGLVSVKQMCHLEEYLVCFSKFSSHHYFHILLFFWGFVVVISESSIYSTDIASQDFIHQLFLPFFFPFVLFFFFLSF